MAKLPELPENNTGRLFIEYTSGGQQHVAQLRLGSSSGAVEAQNVYATFAPLIAAFLHTSDSVTGARWSAAGTNVSWPLGVSASAGATSAPLVPEAKPYFYSWVGRSLNGRRVRFTVFSPFISSDDNYRHPASVGGSYAALLAALNNQANNIVSKEGTAVVWNNYINIGSNAYFQRKLRRSG